MRIKKSDSIEPRAHRERSYSQSNPDTHAAKFAGFSLAKAQLRSNSAKVRGVPSWVTKESTARRFASSICVFWAASRSIWAEFVSITLIIRSYESSPPILPRILAKISAFCLSFRLIVAFCSVISYEFVGSISKARLKTSIDAESCPKARSALANRNKFFTLAGSNSSARLAKLLASSKFRSRRLHSAEFPFKMA